MDKEKGGGGRKRQSEHLHKHISHFAFQLEETTRRQTGKQSTCNEEQAAALKRPASFTAKLTNEILFKACIQNATKCRQDTLSAPSPPLRKNIKKHKKLAGKYKYNIYKGNHSNTHFVLFQKLYVYLLQSGPIPAIRRQKRC